MSRLLNYIRKLEKKDNKAVLIEQLDGTVARFRQSDLAPAYLNLCDRQRAAFDGEEVPNEHPLLEAARNSSDPHWQRSFYSEELPEPGDDMSEK